MPEEADTKGAAQQGEAEPLEYAFTTWSGAATARRKGVVTHEIAARHRKLVAFRRVPKTNLPQQNRRAAW